MIHSILCILIRLACHKHNIDAELKSIFNKLKPIAKRLEIIVMGYGLWANIHPSMMSVTSNTCDGKIRGYILKFLPKRGI